MALTKADLQAMENLLDRKLDEKLEVALAPIKSSIRELKKGIELLQSQMVGVTARLDDQATAISGLKSDFEDLNGNVDKMRDAISVVIDTRRDVTVIQKHLGFRG